MRLRSRAFLPFASALLLLAVLGACSSAPSQEGASVTQSSDLINGGGGGGPTTCSAVCEGVTTCETIRVGTKSCACTGDCAAGLTCATGKCVVPAPTCTGDPPAYQTWWVPGATHIEFQMLQPGELPNTDTQCKSGCGPTAWAMFFGQIDNRWRALAEAGEVSWWNDDPDWFTGVQVAADTVDWGGNYPMITMDIAHHLGASCSAPFGSGAYTEPSWMVSVVDYLDQGPEAAYYPHGPLQGYTAPGWAYDYETHGTGDSLIPDYDNAYGTLDYARDWIINYGFPVVYGYFQRPAHAHYGLATGYREAATAWSCETYAGSPRWVVTRSDNTNWQFFVNGGGGDVDGDGWKSAPAYYVGTLKIHRQ
jgi:hypothetical protein